MNSLECIQLDKIIELLKAFFEKPAPYFWETSSFWLALIIAVITWKQWNTSEQQRRQELFERRFSLYEQAFAFLYKHCILGQKVKESDLLPIANEASFLFNKSVANHILSIASYNDAILNYDWFNKPFNKFMKLK